MSKIIDSINLADLKTAFFENLKCYLSHLIDPSSLEPIDLNSEDFKDTLIQSGLSLTFFNGIFFENAESVESIMSSNSGKISQFNSPFQVWFHPRVNGKDIVSVMKPQGFRYIGDEIGVAIEISSMNKRISYPKSLYIEAVNTEERLEKWLDVAKLLFNYRGDTSKEYIENFKDIDFKEKRYWRKYIGWLNGEPSVVGTLIYGGGIAVVYDESLLLHLKRNRWGIDDALILKLLTDASEDGFKIGGVLSSTGELRKYLKLGFQEKCKLSRFVKV